MFKAGQNGAFPNPNIRAAMKTARMLISRSHGLSRLDEIWGASGKLRQPIQDIIAKMGTILQEYLSSRDVAEVGRCLHDLAVPHFLHEVCD